MFQKSYGRSFSCVQLGKLRRLFQCFKGSSQVVVHP